MRNTIFTRNIERENDELKEANIYIYIYRNSESSGVETAEVEQGKKKLKKKHVGNTPSAKKTVGSMKHRLSSQRKYLL